LEGADEIFDGLSTEAVVLDWLRGFKRLRDSRHARHSFTDGMCQLWYLRQELPIPQEAIEAYGSVFAFLGNCPSIVFSKHQKLVGLNDKVDLESFKLPVKTSAADESAWRHASERRASRFEALEVDPPMEAEAARNGLAASGTAASGSCTGAKHNRPPLSSREDHDGVWDVWKTDRRSRSRSRGQGYQGRPTSAGPDDPLRHRTGRQQERSSTEPEGPAAPFRGRNGSGDWLYSHGTGGIVTSPPAGYDGDDDDDVAAAAAINLREGGGEQQLSATAVEQLVRRFTGAVLRAVADAPRHYLEHSHVESLLPVRLWPLVKQGGPVDLAKFVADHAHQLEVVPLNGRLVVRQVPQNEQRQGKLQQCAYWDPSKWTGCFKAARCSFRHDLSLSGSH
jgi:hypothetical protein